MTDRPIIFTADSVRAILEGRKSQTRRAMKNQPELREYYKPYHPQQNNGVWTWLVHTDRPGYAFAVGDRRCPYGVPGDRLWVRESWAPVMKSGGVMPQKGRFHRDNVDYLIYRAMEAEQRKREWRFGQTTESRWRTPLFMPRWASRIILEITDVRVQRVQEISEQDALAEGIKAMTGQFSGCFVVAEKIGKGGGMSGTNARECYRRIWDSINAKRGFSWESNPWVWAVTFRRLP